MRTKTALFCSAAAGVAFLLSIPAGAHAQETTTSWKGAPQFQNDTLTFKVRGRVYYDIVDQDVEFANPGALDLNSTASRLRTARLGVEGTWNANWGYKAEFSIVGANSDDANRNQVQWEDLMLEYKPSDYASIVVGNFKTVSFENVSSSRYTQFMERGAFNDVLDVGRVASAQFKMNGEAWTAAVFAQGDSLNAADPALGNSEQFAIGARGTFAPINGDNTKLHLGAWVRDRDRGQGGSALRYRVRNNTNFGARYVDTGAIGDEDFQVGAEALFIHKAFSVQGEYAKIEVERTSPAAASEDIDAFYVAASWFPTGEMRNLDVKRGELGRTKILNPMTGGGWGALELAVRYDNVDASDAFSAGPPTVSPAAGEYQALTFGVNWYPHPYTRFMINYSKAENDLTPTLAAPEINPDVDVDTLQFRAQFDF